MVLTVGSYAIAAELQKDHPSTYTVVKGDTLWDIAGRFLRKPWQWPEIWQANPQIANPHRIYPGDVISLAYLDGQPTLTSTAGDPQIRVGDPVNAIALGELQAFLKQLDVRGDDIRDLPYIIGLEDDRLISSAGQTAYARGLNAQVGDQVRIVRPTAQYFAVDPPTRALRDGVNDLDYRGRAEHRDWELVWSEARISDDRKGKFLGNEVMTQALAEVTQVQGDTAVLLLKDEGRDVRPGDRVVSAEEKPYDATYFPHPPTSVPPDVRVLAIADGLRGAGTRSVVALAVGSAQGVDNGTVFSIWSPGARHADKVKFGNALMAKANAVDLPDEFDGHAMVFRTFENVSYALVMDGIRPVKINDRVKHPDAAQ